MFECEGLLIFRVENLMNMASVKNVNKRKALTLAVRMEVVKRLEANESQVSVA